MNEIEEKSKILDVIHSYVKAFEEARADVMQSLFWVDDPRFVEVENHIPKPFGRQRFLDIMDWMKRYQKPGWKMSFYDTKVHILTPEVAYSVSLRDQVEDGESKASRVSLVFLKKENEWKIIHGHFSYVPQ